MRIAIVGVGTAGACMLDSLYEMLGDRSDVSVTLYDPAPEPRAGRAFREDGDCILANSPVPTMSIRHGDSGHAERWLVERGYLEPDSSTLSFFPRALYGRYIVDHADNLVGEMRRRGWRVDFVRERATALTRHDASGYTIEGGGHRDPAMSRHTTVLRRIRSSASAFPRSAEAPCPPYTAHRVSQAIRSASSA